MKVVIHGGMYKTGTTSLQHALAEASKELVNEGIIYPNSPILQHSEWLNVRNPLWNAAFLTELAIKAEASGATVLLLSGETVCSNSEEQFKKLTTCFKHWPVEYVFSFRHWSSYLPSRWAQSCLRRDTQNFDEYLALVLDPKTKHYDVHFDLIIARALASGATTVRSVSWDNAIETHKSINPALLSALGFSDQQKALIREPKKWLNAHQSILIVEFCRLLNGFLDSKQNRKQNELFWAYAYHKDCTHFYDIIHKINTMDESTTNSIFEIIEAFGVQKTMLPNFDTFEENLFTKYGNTFVNLQNSQIFHNQKTKLQEFDHYPIAWETFIEYAVAGQRRLIEKIIS